MKLALDKVTRNRAQFSYTTTWIYSLDLVYHKTIALPPTHTRAHTMCMCHDVNTSY